MYATSVIARAYIGVFMLPWRSANTPSNCPGGVSDAQNPNIKSLGALCDHAEGFQMSHRHFNAPEIKLTDPWNPQVQALVLGHVIHHPIGTLFAIVMFHS